MADHDDSQDIELELEEEGLAEIKKKDKNQKLKDELKAAKEEAKTNLDGWQRSRADYVNLQKQTETERIDVRKRAIEGFVLDMLPALDTFDMAMRDKQAWEAVDEKWRTGIEYIYSQLQKTLENNNITPIDNPNTDFDPEQHEPLEIVETDDKKQDNKIIEILQKGYRTEQRVLRPAKVKLYKAN